MIPSGMKLENWKLKMTKSEIYELQVKLNKLGYGPIEEDSQYGKNTEAAYRRYLDDLDPNVPTVIPLPEKKWWMSKALIGGAATILVSIIGIFGYELDAEFTSQMITSLITLITGVLAVIGTIKNKGAIDTTYVNPFNQPKPLTRPYEDSFNQPKPYEDPRGSFKDI